MVLMTKSSRRETSSLSSFSLECERCQSRDSVALCPPTGREGRGFGGARPPRGVRRSQADQHGHFVHPDGDDEGPERVLHLHKPPPTTSPPGSRRHLRPARQLAEILLCNF